MIRIRLLTSSFAATILDSVKLVLAVGFAWGARPVSQGGDQRIGDVIVATKCINAGHSKAGSDGDEIRGMAQVTPLADTVNSMLCSDWPRESQTHFDQERIPEPRPKAHIGTVISLPKLIDDAETALKLITHPQIEPLRPIGGDMELYQIAAAAVETGKHWLLVKGICDFAGLDGGPKMKDGQPLAVAVAVNLTEWLCKAEEVMAFLSSRENNRKRQSYD